MDKAKRGTGDNQLRPHTHNLIKIPKEHPEAADSRGANKSHDPPRWSALKSGK